MVHNTAIVVFLLLSILKKYEISNNSNREDYRISNTKILDGQIRDGPQHIDNCPRVCEKRDNPFI
jgi:hypothetical protein